MENDVMWSSKNMDWSTPQDFFDKLNDEFHFTLDPCADETNHKCDKYYTEEEDAWTTAWKLFPEYKELQVLKQFDNTFDAPTLSKLENGVFLPTPYQVIKLTLFFECEPLELVALDLYALDVCVANKAVASCEKGA